MTKTKAVIYASIVCFLSIVSWMLLWHHDRKVDSRIVSVTLPPQDQEKLIINEHTHTITDVKRGPNGKVTETKEFSGPRTSIEIFAKGNSSKISTRKWGTEVSPSIGVLYGSDFQLRGTLTFGLFYYTRWEFGVGMGMASRIDTARTLVDLQYNCWDNILVGAYVDNQKNAGVIATLRF